MRLKDKVSIITGGAAGIGKAYAMRFADEGAKLVIADINLAMATATAEELEQKGAESLAIGADVSSLEDTQRTAKETIDRFGRIDVLINNAAIFGRVKVDRVPFWELSVEQWDRSMAVNLRGTFLCSQAVFPYMKAQGGGKIINIGSGSSFLGLPNYVHYVASKGGIVALTRALAREAGEYNINVNCIVPGSTFSEDPSDQAEFERRKRDVAPRAMKRIEYPEDLVGTAVFLASSDSDFITGQTIMVDGGAIMQ